MNKATFVVAYHVAYGAGVVDGVVLQVGVVWVVKVD